MSRSSSREDKLLALVAKELITACDQIGEALAHAQREGDEDLPPILLPALGTLWSLRWELTFWGSEPSTPKRKPEPDAVVGVASSEGGAP